MALETIDMKALNKALDDMNYPLIKHKMETYQRLCEELPRRIQQKDFLKWIRAPREVIDGQVRILVKRLGQFYRLHQWATATASDEYIETVICGQAEELMN